MRSCGRSGLLRSSARFVRRGVLACHRECSADHFFSTSLEMTPDHRMADMRSRLPRRGPRLGGGNGGVSISSE